MPTEDGCELRKPNDGQQQGLVEVRIVQCQQRHGDTKCGACALCPEAWRD